MVTASNSQPDKFVVQWLNGQTLGYLTEERVLHIAMLVMVDIGPAVFPSIDRALKAICQQQRNPTETWIVNQLVGGSLRPVATLMWNRDGFATISRIDQRPFIVNVSVTDCDEVIGTGVIGPFNSEGAAMHWATIQSEKPRHPASPVPNYMVEQLLPPY